MNKKDNDLAKLFNIKKFHSAYVSNLAKENGIGVGCLVFLKALSAANFHSQHQLSEYIGCNKAHTSRIVTKMQQSGLVEISQNKNLEDKIVLTKKGETIAKKVESLDKQYISKLLQDIPEEELEIFRKVCMQIYNNSERLLNG